MRFTGGYNINLAGKPGRSVEVLPEPESLFIPLGSRRLSFTEICVDNGQQVNAGDILARDPGAYGIPLLAPRAGTVRLNAAEGHVVLENITGVEESALPVEELAHIEKQVGPAGARPYRLVTCGAWEFFFDAHTGGVPDPHASPQAVIVSTVSLEPFVAAGDAQLQNRLLQFTRGLEHLQAMLEYQPIYLVVPKVDSAFAARVKDHIRGYAWVKIVEIPNRYGCDHFAVLARRLHLKRKAGPVWAVRSEGVLAVDRAMTLGRPCTVKIVSVGGPAARSPSHVKACTGYPVDFITERFVEAKTPRIINGGVMTGDVMAYRGLDTECRGLTILAEPGERQFLGFARPGTDRRSYAACFLGNIRRDLTEKLTSAMRGERRPCISCGFCAEVCPASIMPNLIHKHLYRDLLEQADRARADLCVGCGLCSYVCPSKIDLRQQMLDAQRAIELDRLEAQAAATAGRE